MGSTSQKLSLCKRIGIYLTIFCIVFNLYVSTVLAGPEGAEVVNGQVAFQKSGYNTTITASDKAIINYNSFNIGQPEIVQFIQPGSNASVLNRILSANPTTIDGTLLANGRVFFVNPAGVYFGSGAQINVAQLVASSLSISNADFIKGQYNFAGGTGSVINRGDISAEKVYLIGKQVANYGNIFCPGGYVIMTSGDRVFLGEMGSDVVVEIAVPSLPLPAEPIEGSAILNEGTVEVGDGTILLAAAGDIYSQAISNVGTLSASSETTGAGQVKLTAVDGTVINSGSIKAKSSSGAGGTVQVLGDKVGLFDAADIDASGSAGGGTVLVGGDYQGKGDTSTASRTYVSPDATIKADAAENGDGGKIIVWSDGSTRAYGSFTARGGVQSGNGGLIETSGHYLDVTGARIDAGAVHGMAGTWLLDPFNVTITAASSMGVFIGPAGSTYTWTPLTTPSTVSNSDISSKLGNTNVTIQTNDGFNGGAQLGTITVSAPILRSTGGSAATTLTLTPDPTAGTIVISAGGSIAGDPTHPLNVNLNAVGGTVSVSDAITTFGGTFQSTGYTFTNAPGGTITTAGGMLTIDQTGVVTINGNLSSSGGDISITGTNLILTTPATVNSGSGNVTLKPNTGSDIGVGTGGGAFSVSDDELSRVQTTGADTGTITIGDRTLASAMIVGGITAGTKNLRLATGGTINDVGTTAVTLTTGTLTLDAASTIGNTTPFDVTVAKLAVKTEANFDITNAGTLTDLSVTTNGAVATQNLLSTGLTYDVAETGSNSTIDAVTSTGALNFSYQNTVGDITVATSGITTNGGVVTLSAGDSVALNATINTGLAPVTLNFGMLGAGGTLDFSGAAALTAATITATGGAGSDIIIGRNVVSTWTLNGSPTYSDGTATVVLSGIETLQGGTLVDIFNVTANTSAVIKGGAGVDVFDITATKTLTGSVDGEADGGTLQGTAIVDATLTTAGTIGFNGTTAAVTGGFSNIDTITGTGAGTLTGANLAATWGLDGTPTYIASAKTLNFSGFGTLQGGTLVDIFNVTAASSMILKGGDGSDVFDIGAALTGSVDGEAGDDTFTGEGGSSISGALTDATGTSTLNGTITAGSVNLTGDVLAAGDITATDITFSSTVTADGVVAQTFDATTGTLWAKNTITKTGAGNLTLGGATAINLDGAVSVSNGDLTLEDNTAVADGKILTASNNLETGAGKTITGEGSLTLVATAGGITENAGDDGKVQINMAAADKTLTLTQNDALNMENGFDVTNSGATDLVANSTGDSVTSTNADGWNKITSTASTGIAFSGISATREIETGALTSTTGNISVESTNNNLNITGAITANGGGVSLIANNGKIYTEDGVNNDTLNKAITGTSNGITGVDLPYDATKKAAIVIISKDDLKLGASATLSAGGTYSTANNDNAGVYFTGGDPIDVAIYLASTGAGTNIAVDSKVTTIGSNGAMVIDAKEKVTFGDTFKDFSAFDTTNWLEAVSRIADIDLNQAISQQILPSADNIPGLEFPGTYILRGDSPAKVLALMTTTSTTKPVPLVSPMALELKDRGEIEGVDMEALLQWGVEELGQDNVQSYLEGAYLYSTDLRPYEALRKLKKLVEEILIDKGCQSQAALVEIVTKYVKEGSQPTEEQICLITVELKNYEAACQCLKALADYVVILNTEIGMTAEGSVKLVMERDGPEDMRGKMFVQMYLECSVPTSSGTVRGCCEVSCQRLD